MTYKIIDNPNTDPALNKKIIVYYNQGLEVTRMNYIDDIQTPPLPGYTLIVE